MSYIIGVDCGTSGTKTVLFDENGAVIASETIEYPMYQPKNGYAEQDPADWSNAMINTIKAVMSQSGVKKEDVKGIGISGQMHGLVMLDKDNRVLRNSIIWCDQRTAAEVEEMNRTVGIGQGTGDEDLAGIGVAGHGTRLLLGDRSKPVIVPVWRGEVIRWPKA